ncbi:hypothetical protein [Candidatus Phytoplasma prunorum]|uniref:hypothetical protein n=1 Tax=Candidatus Phytoplasma prunorum TaxID=47565 RepID=UPI002FF2492A
MLSNKKTFLIGEKVKVDNEKEIGVVTRIDFESGVIYVLFKKMREQSYPYPESLHQNVIKPVFSKNKNNY